jgi:hypothetical protein
LLPMLAYAKAYISKSGRLSTKGVASDESMEIVECRDVSGGGCCL